MVEFLVVFNDFFFCHSDTMQWLISIKSLTLIELSASSLQSVTGPDLGLFLPNCDIFDRFILKNEINNKLPEITQIRFKIYV